MRILDSFETVNNRRELHILTLSEGKVFTGEKKRVEINITKEDRRFIDKLDTLVPVTTTVDIYYYLFGDETIHKNKYEILMNMIDEDKVFKTSKYTQFEPAKREHLKQKYNWSACTNMDGMPIRYKDSTAEVKCEYENKWVTEVYAREIIKKFENGEFSN
ncbi:hypothetical protein TPDSL_17810 [Terrisporobacter petrolearius]|uniref:hypothetical protein n=1 Tax=Terrisporobacter petrolearius TaxID=1460447 RepID=UPI0033689696